MNYKLCSDSIYRPNSPIQHRDEEYDQVGFETLWAMQNGHFWYRGRHKFLLSVIDRYLPNGTRLNAAIDLGGGVGGWINYLVSHRPNLFDTLSLADSSEIALKMASNALPEKVNRYQIDLMSLGWKDEWDCAFLLDVIEHLPDDAEAIRQAGMALKPGGYLFITTPALQNFWSYNDVLAHHHRRYSANDFKALAISTGLQLCDTRYFMFLLSPLYWLSRLRFKALEMSKDDQDELMKKSHRVPNIILNLGLTGIFFLETLLGRWVRFPWGTSILTVLRKS